MKGYFMSKMKITLLACLFMLILPMGVARLGNKMEAGESKSSITPPDVKFKMHVVNAESAFEAASVFDVNRDGKLDIFCGGYWYEAPNWKKHFVREVPLADDYYLDFANMPSDVDGDGWTDIVGGAWHNESIYWVRNPGNSGKPWEYFTIDKPGFLETVLAVDINGDGQADFLPNMVGSTAWYEYKRDAASPQGVKWIKHSLPKAAAGHGVGAGDINGDGRCDIVAPNGWLEQPAAPEAEWIWHPEFSLGSTSVPILVEDVNGDGRAELIYGMGHDYGLFWMEQENDTTGKRVWAQHKIDSSWSQPHFMLMANLDADGIQELVVGKRAYAHRGKDPGDADPLCVYYYKFDLKSRQWSRHVISEGGHVGFGINTMAVDLDGDGDIDIICPGKSGLYWMENLRK
jgi:hypothetical protein